MFQLFEESVALQNTRLERQQTLQKQHLKELRDFSEEYSSDSDGSRYKTGRRSLTSEQSATSLSAMV